MDRRAPSGPQISRSIRARWRLLRSIAGNQVEATGSGILAAGSAPRLLHNTLAGNQGGDGSGIAVAQAGALASNLAMTNTILVSQTGGISPL